jgi:hypothetical protein
MLEFSVSSALAASPSDLWNHAASASGVNREFRPLLRMTFPPGVEAFAETWEPGKRLCRSWILLFGVLPLDYDDLTLVEVDPGRRFLERSSMLTQRVWEHERRIDPIAGGCRVTDRVRFVPKITPLGPIYRAVFARIFAFRHWNLRQVFGQL